MVPLLIVVLAMVLVGTEAFAQTAPSKKTLDEAHQRVDQLDSQLSDAQAQAQAAKRDVDAVTQRLETATKALEKADEKAKAADKAAAAARADSLAANQRLGASQAALATNRDKLYKFARDSYKFGPGVSTPAMAMLENINNIDGPTGAADTLHILELALGDKTNLVEEAHRLVTQTAQYAKDADSARQKAEVELASADKARDEAATLHAQVLSLMDEAEAALERQQQAVSDTNSQLSAAKKKVSDLEAQKRAAEKAAAERAARERAARVGSVAIGGGLVRVGGITVAGTLAPRLEALLKAARADGIVLGGSGYRSTAVTAKLRIINGCPDVNQSPSWTCRVPTARPGHSMHERGLAIDFTWRGRTICYPSPPSACHGNAAFDWLQRNAGKYGLHNLSTEAWHWSTNGN